MSSFGVTEFNLAIEYALRVLGKEKLTLKQAQRHAIYQTVSEGKDVLAVLPTGFGKSLVYQILAPIFDYLNCGMEPDDKQKSSLVIIVSPLNALIQHQISKLSDKVSVCVANAERVISVDERDRKASQRLSLDGIPSNCQILFAHPEAVIEMRDIRSTSVQRKAKAIIVDEVNLISSSMVGLYIKFIIRIIHVSSLMRLSTLFAWYKLISLFCFQAKFSTSIE